MVEMEEVVPPVAANAERFGLNVQSFAAYFYAVDRLLTSMQATRPQRAFDTLV